MKKIILAILFLLAIGSTYALTIEYTKQTTVQHEVTVGSTVLVQEGLLVTPYNLEQGNLTYFEIEETTTQRHYLTYVYNYEIISGVYDIQVSSLTNDVVVTSVVIGDRVSVTFALNQDMEFVEGQVLEIGLLFELVEITLGSYTSSNPININNATEQELVDVGFTQTEATNTLSAGAAIPFADLAELAYRIGSPTLVDRYQKYEDAGVIVFN